MLLYSISALMEYLLSNQITWSILTVLIGHNDVLIGHNAPSLVLFLKCIALTFVIIIWLSTEMPVLFQH